MSESAIDLKLEHDQARRLEVTDTGADNPAVKALTEAEQVVWRLHRQGVDGRVIGEMMGMRKDCVCRMLAGIRQQIAFLHRFWALIRRSDTDFFIFCGRPLSVCPG